MIKNTKVFIFLLLIFSLGFIKNDNESHFLYDSISNVQSFSNNEFYSSLVNEDLNICSDDITEQQVPLDINLNDNWKFDVTNISNVWDEILDLTSNSDVIVAVLDTGVKLNHPDLDLLVLDGSDVAEGDDDPSDFHSHGTHMSGTIGAKSNDSQDNVVGIAPGIKIMPVKVFKNNGTGNAPEFMKGVYYAVDNGADVINLSVYATYHLEGLQEALEYAESKGVVVIAGSGNSSNHWGVGDPFNRLNYSSIFNSVVTYPGAYETVLSVGNVGYKNGVLGIDDTSNIGGLYQNSYRELDVVAPGVNIFSSNLYDFNTARVKTGTSVSTSFVSGVAALLVSKYPQLTPKEIRTIIKDTAYDPDIVIPSIHERKEVIGSGMVDVQHALAFSPLKSFEIENHPDFVYETMKYDYKYDVDYDITGLTFNSVMMENSSFKLEGNVIVDPATINIDLKYGKNIVNVEVALKGVIRTYQIEIFRHSPPNLSVGFVQDGEVYDFQFNPDIRYHNIGLEPLTKKLNYIFSISNSEYNSMFYEIDGILYSDPVVNINELIDFHVPTNIKLYLSSDKYEMITYEFNIINRPLSTDGSLKLIKIDAPIPVVLSTEGLNYFGVVDDSIPSVGLYVESNDKNAKVSINCSHFNGNIENITCNISSLANIYHIDVLTESNDIVSYLLVLSRPSSANVITPLGPLPADPLPDISVSVRLDTDAIVLDYGLSANPDLKSYDFSEIVSGTSKKEVKWILSNSEYVSVDEKGLVTSKVDIPIGTGDIIVTLTVKTVVGGVTDTAEILFEEKTPLGSADYVGPYISGYSDGTFRPKNYVSRAEVATIFSKILDLDLSSTSSQIFDDVNEDHWGYSYIQSMFQTRIFVGYLEGDKRLFNPDAPISRAEIAQVFTNYWSYKRIEVDGTSKYTIPDVPSTHWAAIPVNRLFNTEIFTGYLNNAYRPDDDTSREQMVNMINKLIARPATYPTVSKFSDISTDYYYFGDIEAASSFYFKKIEK